MEKTYRIDGEALRKLWGACREALAYADYCNAATVARAADWINGAAVDMNENEFAALSVAFRLLTMEAREALNVLAGIAANQNQEVK